MKATRKIKVWFLKLISERQKNKQQIQTSALINQKMDQDCKIHDEFYAHFGTIHVLRKHIFKYLFMTPHFILGSNILLKVSKIPFSN